MTLLTLVPDGPPPPATVGMPGVDGARAGMPPRLLISFADPVAETPSLELEFRTTRGPRTDGLLERRVSGSPMKEGFAEGSLNCIRRRRNVETTQQSRGQNLTPPSPQKFDKASHLAVRQAGGRGEVGSSSHLGGIETYGFNLQGHPQQPDVVEQREDEEGPEASPSDDDEHSDELTEQQLAVAAVEDAHVVHAGLFVVDVDNVLLITQEPHEEHAPDTRETMDRKGARGIIDLSQCQKCHLSKGICPLPLVVCKKFGTCLQFVNQHLSVDDARSGKDAADDGGPPSDNGAAGSDGHKAFTRSGEGD